jgi:hypothetical protein
MSSTTELIARTALSTSPIWDIQRRWYETHAIPAWKAGKLPHWISSNTFIAAKYANLIVSFARDVWTNTSSEQPIHIVELGAGHGKLSFLILKHLVSLREFWPASNCFRYVMTDFAPSTIEFWKTQSNLAPYFDDGLLDYALFDCDAADNDLHLARTGIALNRSSLQRPVVVVANYVFSALKQDHLQFFGSDTGGSTKCAQCTVVVPKADDDSENDRSGNQDEQDDHTARFDTAPEMNLFPTNAEIQFEHVNAKDAVPYDLIDPTLSKLIQRVYVDSGKDMSVGVPLGALRCIRSLQRMTANTSMMMLVGDKGYDTLNDHERSSRDPHVVFHGCLSFMVNFHCIEEYVREMGGFTLRMLHRSSAFKVQSYLFGGTKTNFRCVLRKWSEEMIDFDPDTFSSYQRLVREETGTPSLKSCLALLRVGRWDSEMFHRMRKAVITQSTRATLKQTEDMVNDAERIWSNVYFLDPNKDIAFELGRVMMGLKRYAHAIGFFTLSNQHYGAHHVTHYNLGICHHWLHKYAIAIEYFDASLKLSPTYEDAKNWKEKSLALLMPSGDVKEEGSDLQVGDGGVIRSAGAVEVDGIA